MIKSTHENVYTPHPGIDKTMALLQKYVYFKNMRDKVSAFIQICHICALCKANKRPLRPHMRLQRVPSATWQEVNVDLMGPIRTHNMRTECEYAIIFEDRFSRWPEIFAIPDATADTVISVFMKHIIPTHGVCKKLIYDNGPCFIANEFQAFCDDLGIKKSPSTPLYPQGNALAELGVCKAKDFLRSLIAQHPNADWNRLIPYALCALRACKNKATGFSPHEIMYNKPLLLPAEVNFPYRKYLITDSLANEEFGYWNALWSTVKGNIEKYHSQMKERFDRKAKFVQLRVGQKVYLRNSYRKAGENKIFSPRYANAYWILEVTGNTLVLEKEDDPHVVMRVNMNRVKPFAQFREVKTPSQLVDDPSGKAKVNKVPEAVSITSDDESKDATASPVKQKTSTKKGKKTRVKIPLTPPSHGYNTRLRTQLTNPAYANCDSTQL